MAGGRLERMMESMEAVYGRGKGCANMGTSVFGVPNLGAFVVGVVEAGGPRRKAMGCGRRIRPTAFRAGVERGSVAVQSGRSRVAVNVVSATTDRIGKEVDDSTNKSRALSTASNELVVCAPAADWEESCELSIPSGAAQPLSSELLENKSICAWGRLYGDLDYLESEEQRKSLKETFTLATRDFSHPLLPEEEDARLSRVVSIVSILTTLKADFDTLKSALIYEAVEDGVLAEAEIPSLALGGDIQAIVEDTLWLTSLPSSFRDYDDENAKLLREYVVEASQDPRAVLVKLAKVLTTMRMINQYPHYERLIKALECLQVYVPLAHAVGAGKVMWDLEDSCFRVLFPESYASVEDWHGRTRQRCQDVLFAARDELAVELNKNKFLAELVESFDISGRTKNLFSTFKKILRDHKKKEDIQDIVGLRVVVNLRREYRDVPHVAREVCFEVMHVVTTLWREVVGRFKDYITHPKPNGYMSMHTTVLYHDDSPLEVQVRTAEMHRDAEYGIASHQFYKGGLGSVEEVNRFAEGMRSDNERILLLPMDASVAASSTSPS